MTSWAFSPTPWRCATIPPPRAAREVEEWVRWTLGSYRDHGFGQWIAILKDSGEFAGQCGLTVQEVEGKEEVEIGYLFLRRFWGRGLATEAARVVRDHGFALGYDRLISIIDPGNLASRRVAEKTGLTLEKEVWKWNKKVCVYAVHLSTSHFSFLFLLTSRSAEIKTSANRFRH